MQMSYLKYKTFIKFQKKQLYILRYVKNVSNFAERYLSCSS